MRSLCADVDSKGSSLAAEIGINKIGRSATKGASDRLGGVGNSGSPARAAVGLQRYKCLIKMPPH